MTMGGRPCVFPFIYNGKTWTQCAPGDWCATEVLNSLSYHIIIIIVAKGSLPKIVQVRKSAQPRAGQVKKKLSTNEGIEMKSSMLAS